VTGRRGRRRKQPLNGHKEKKGYWIGHILRKNCLLKHIIEGNIEGREVTGRQGRRREQLLNDHTGKKGYWNFKEEALDRALRRTRFGRGYGPVVKRQQDAGVNVWVNEVIVRVLLGHCTIPIVKAECFSKCSHPRITIRKWLEVKDVEEVKYVLLSAMSRQ
jgi:hypothetical protein